MLKKGLVKSITNQVFYSSRKKLSGSLIEKSVVKRYEKQAETYNCKYNNRRKSRDGVYI